MLNKIKNIGPGVLVAAAFIGPGTVTACTLAGANYGYTLLWALTFATLATIVLQEMSARLGTVSQQGLGETLINELRTSAFKWPLIGLLLAALYGGNAAYEAGNLAGAALGVEAVFGSEGWVRKTSIIVLAAFGILVLGKGQYQHIEKILVCLVVLMALAFVLTFFIVRPDLLEMFSGVFKPSVPSGSLMTVIALIGTTVVPYNLFLHASAAKSRWRKLEEGSQKNSEDSFSESLSAARSDAVISIGLGGLVAILITSTAAASIYANALSVNNAADMAVQFEPIFGSLAKYFLGIGLFAAGLSSAITAPLATSFALSELLEFKGGEQSVAFRAVSVSILVIGATLALTGIKPIKLIVLAQFANGLLLPIVACFLLYAMNRKQLLGRYSNGVIANALGAGVVVFTAVLGVRSILSALNVI